MFPLEGDTGGEDLAADLDPAPRPCGSAPRRRSLLCWQRRHDVGVVHSRHGRAGSVLRRWSASPVLVFLRSAGDEDAGAAAPGRCGGDGEVGEVPPTRVQPAGGGRSAPPVVASSLPEMRMPGRRPRVHVFAPPGGCGAAPTRFFRSR